MEVDRQATFAGSWRPGLIALGLWMLLAAVASLSLWHLRREALGSQARELGLLSLALTDDIDRGLRGAEEGLHALRAELRAGRLPMIGTEAVPALHSRAELMPLVQTLWLVDRDGHVLAASDTTPAPALASFAPALDRLGSEATAVSRPFSGLGPGAGTAANPNAGGGRSLVALAIRFDDALGGTGGWIIAAMPASTLLGAFTAASPAADARMTVFRSDGVRLASARATALSLDEAGVARRLANRPMLEVRRLQDGSENLVGLHSVPRYDIKVLVARDLSAVLTSWRQTATVSATALALLLAIMLAAVYFVQRADRRRSEAQRALQAQLARASKLESLGTLAGGVAHDFNNVLAGIVGFAEMAQDAAPLGSSQARHLDKVLQAALRGKSLVERILAFSRGGAQVATVFELEPVVEEVLTLLSASLRAGIVLERVLNAQGARLRGDATQVFEAVMNLCANAMQAMPNGGMLSVQLERVQVAAPRVLSHTQLPAGDHLSLSVSDQGDGIVPEVMERLFEPFFTTRAAQSGTGLGLAVVFGVVAEFGGAIDVRSAPGHGACFTLYFPECRDDVNVSEPGAGVARTGTGQQVLVVDDEPELVALAEDVLTALGYKPVGFDDSMLALQALREDPRRFAAVITDERMPRLGGTELTLALRRFAPLLPVLLISGYGGTALAQRASAAGVTRVLAKPLQRAGLARALAEVLG